MSGSKKHLLMVLAAGALLALPLSGCGGGGGLKTGGGTENEPGVTEPGGDTGVTEPDGDGGVTEPDDDTGTTEPGDDSGATEPDGDSGSETPDVPGEDASPAAELSVVGEVRTSPVGDAGGAVTAAFNQWGVWGGIPREDVATCTAIGCPPAGDTLFLAYSERRCGTAP